MTKAPSIKQLRKAASKQSTNGFLNPMCDYLAFYPAKLFLYLPISPVQITILWIMIKILMAMLLIKGGYLLTLSALVIFQLASILDGVDGIVARFRKDYSYNGIYLDYVGHYLCNSLLLLGLAAGIYRQTGNITAIIAAAIAVFFFLFSKAITINLIWLKTAEMRLDVERMVYADGFSLKSQKRGFLSLFADFLLLDNPLNLMFWGILFNLPLLTLWAYTIFLTLEAFRRMALQYYRIRTGENSGVKVKTNTAIGTTNQ